MEVIAAGFWGFVGGAALLIGAMAGLWPPASQRTIGLIMAFGAGVLISALAFELTDEAYRRGGTATVGFGIAAGALSFFFADLLVDRRDLSTPPRDRAHQPRRAEEVDGRCTLSLAPLVCAGLRAHGGARGIGAYEPTARPYSQATPSSSRSRWDA